MRNVAKVISESRDKINPYYDLCAGELNQLYDVAEKSVAHALCDAFVFGYEMGNRASRAAAKRKQKAPAMRQHCKGKP